MSSINLGLPDRPLTENPELNAELRRVYNALDSVVSAVDAYSGTGESESTYSSQVGTSQCFFGVNSKVYLEAAEEIEFGQLVALHSDGLLYKAAPPLTCIGFSRSKEPAAYIEVQLVGVYPRLSSAVLVPGVKYCLGTTPGTFAPFSSGAQVVGIALAPDILFINPQL